MTRIISSIVFILAAIGIFFQFTSPILKEIDELNLQEVSFSDARDNSEELKKLRDDIMTKYNTISANDLRKLDKFLPSQMEAIRLIMEIEGVAGKYGIVLKSIGVEKKEEVQDENGKKNTPKPSVVEENFKNVPLEMTIVGTYKSFLSFASDLERSLRLIDIKHIDFISGEKGPSEFNVRATTFWKK